MPYSRPLSRRAVLTGALAPFFGALTHAGYQRLPLQSAAALAGAGTTRAARHGSWAATPPALTAQGARSPQVIVLGTAQDAGVPQANCFTGICRRVRSGAVPRPRVASIGIADPIVGRRFLIDATPDFVTQVGDLLAVPDGVPDGVVPLHEHLHGILLTHAHMGHYTGLVHCGKEGAATRSLPVWGDASMIDYLDTNQPWKVLIDGGYIDPVRVEHGTPFQLTDSVEVTPLQVIHRAELTGMTGYLVRGPQRALLYVPDADTWEGWEITFDDWLDRADVALIDGSFWSGAELGHRPQAEVPHPPVSLTIELFGQRPQRPETWFTHLNHTNPLWDPESPERRELEAAGFGVAATGQTLSL